MSLVERLRKLYAGVVYDAAYYDVGHRDRFVIDRGIRHLVGDVPMVGRAFTCWGTRATVHGKTPDPDEADAVRLDVFGALTVPGLVVMMDTDQDATVAHFGDITAQVLEDLGVAGVVIDGYTRDVGRIRLPTFARGVQPQDAYGKWSLQRHSKPVLFSTSGGNRITVNPGDMVFADRDGVMVLPARITEDVVDAAEARAADELAIRNELRRLSPRDVYGRLGRW